MVALLEFMDIQHFDSRLKMKDFLTQMSSAPVNFYIEILIKVIKIVVFEENEIKDQVELKFFLLLFALSDNWGSFARNENRMLSIEKLVSGKKLRMKHSRKKIKLAVTLEKKNLYHCRKKIQQLFWKSRTSKTLMQWSKDIFCPHIFFKRNNFTSYLVGRN